MTAREVVKAAARATASLLIAPMWASFALRSRLFDPDRALQGSSQLLALVPGLAGQYVRRAFLRRAIRSCHTTAVIEYGTILSRAGARFDEHAYVGPGCRLGLVHVERDVLIAAGVHVPSGPLTHRFDDPARPIRDQERAETLVRIGAGAWIGAGAIVMADVGRGAIVGAGAVVTHPVPAFTVVAGVPARVMRTRNQAAQAV